MLMLVSPVLNRIFLFFSFLYASVSAYPQGYPEEKLDWNLSVQTYTFKEFTFEEAVRFAKDIDLKTIEVYFGQKLTKNSDEVFSAKLSDDGRRFVNNVLRENDIKILGFGVVGAKDKKEWRELFEFAQELNVEFLNVEPNEEILSFIGVLADEFKIKVAIHNHPKPSHYWHPEIVMEAIEKANSSYVGACADIGHWIRSGLDPIDCLKHFEGKLFSLHMKDLNEKNNRSAHDVHWGTGVSGIPEVIKELKRQGFQGNISCEYEYNWLNNKEDVAVSIKNFREMLN